MTGSLWLHVCLGRRGKPSRDVVMSLRLSGGTENIRHNSQVVARVDSGNSWICNGFKPQTLQLAIHSLVKCVCLTRSTNTRVVSCSLPNVCRAVRVLRDDAGNCSHLLTR